MIDKLRPCLPGKTYRTAMRKDRKLQRIRQKLAFQYTHIKLRIMRNDDTSLKTLPELRPNPCKIRLIRHHARRNAVASTPNIIVVHPSVPARTLGELLALAKARPGQINFGSTSPGGSPHMSAELLKMMAGVDMTHVPYKGASPMLTDLMGGQIQAGFDNLPSTIAFVRSGKLRALAVTTTQRWPGAADIPSVAESVPGYEVSGWFGLLAPAGTPKAVLDTLQTAVAQAVRDPEVTRQLRSLGAEPVASRPETFAQQIRADVDKWRGVVKATGVTLE